MVNELRSYSVFLVYRPLKVLYTTCQHLHTHSCTEECAKGLTLLTRTDQGFGVAQGHFDTLSGGAGDCTRNLPITRRPLHFLSRAFPDLIDLLPLEGSSADIFIHSQTCLCIQKTQTNRALIWSLATCRMYVYYSLSFQL